MADFVADYMADFGDDFRILEEIAWCNTNLFCRLQDHRSIILCKIFLLEILLKTNTNPSDDY